MHPILGMMARLVSWSPSTPSIPILIYPQGHDGAVVRVYGPPLDHYIGPNGLEFPLLLQEGSRTVIPQPPYECGNVQKDWVPKPPILFFTRNDLGVKLLNARDGMFEGVNDRDQPPFDAACRGGTTIRIHVGPSTIGALTMTHFVSSCRGTLPVLKLRRH